MSAALGGSAPGCDDAPDPGDAPGPIDGTTRLVLGVSYDGAGFHGFAEQPEVRTVAGELASALERVFGVRSRLVCAGRTDAGVHARCQVVHLDVPTEALLRRYPDRSGRALPGLARSLTHQLGGEVGVFSAEVAPPGFDARRSALWRRYRYDLDTSGRMDPGRRRTSWLLEHALDLPAMRLGADPLIGEHDFAAFCRHAPGERGPIRRRVLEARLNTGEDGLVRFEIAATAFCQQMVRSIVGVLVAIGEGRARPPDVVQLLRSGSRQGAPRPAPALGLTLIGVGYPDELGGART